VATARTDPGRRRLPPAKRFIGTDGKRTLRTPTISRRDANVSYWRKSDRHTEGLDFLEASSLRRRMEEDDDDMFYDRLITALEAAVDLCVLATRDAWRRQIAELCADAAEVSAKLLRRSDEVPTLN